MEESLTAIAYKAGFKNLHDTASLWAGLLGSVVSDEFEMIYFLSREDQKVDIFGVVEQSNPQNCALYRFERSELERSSRDNLAIRVINIDRSEPLHTGQTAVAVLESYDEL